MLQDLSLSVAAGEVALLVGANGCGKSTTLRLLAGLTTPDAGRIVLAGHDAGADPAAARAGLSFLPQSPRFHERLTTAQILAFYARLRGLPASRVDVVAAAGASPSTCASRPAGCRAGPGSAWRSPSSTCPTRRFSCSTSPASASIPTGASLQSHLRRVAAEGRTVLVATHLLGEWDGQADRCLVIDKGQVEREVPPAGLRDAFPFACRGRPSPASPEWRPS